MLPLQEKSLFPDGRVQIVDEKGRKTVDYPSGARVCAVCQNGSGRKYLIVICARSSSLGDSI